jgi:predicted SAM-dependent methyltransferase
MPISSERLPNPHGEIRAPFKNIQTVDALEQITASIAAEHFFQIEGRIPSDRFTGYWKDLDEGDRQKWRDSVRVGFALIMAAAVNGDLSLDDKKTVVGWLDKLKLTRLSPSTNAPEEIVARYLHETSAGERGINLGCGGRTFIGWLNIDMELPHHADIVWDLTKGLPFLPEGQFDAIYSEHFLEHIPRKSAMELLQDCYFSLRPSGHIRTALPDLDEVIRVYRENEKHPTVNESQREELGEVFGTRCELLNIAMRAWGHTYIYNREDIELTLRHAGFVDVKTVELGRSEIPLLSNREVRSASESSLIIEARKPG